MGEVCEIVNGGTPDTNIKEFWNGDLLWISPKDLGKLNEIYVDETSRMITQLGLKNSSAKLLPINSVILSSRAPIGHLAINKKPMATNQGCKGLIPKNSLDALYLFHFLFFSKDHLNDLGIGATFKELSGSKLGTVEIPLPPLPEQHRIVTLLDKAFAALAQAKTNLEQNLKNARHLFESYLQSVFENKGEDWEEKTVGEISDHCLGKMLDKAKNKGTNQKYLRNQNVRWFEFDLTEVFEMPFTDNELEKYSARKGDLLICEGGYPARAAIWDSDESIFFQKALHRVRFHKPNMNRWFLYFLSISDSNGYLKKHFTGTGIQHFTGQALDKMKIPIPQQNSIEALLTKFDFLSSHTQKLETLYRPKLAGLEEMKKAILQKAFSGQI